MLGVCGTPGIDVDTLSVTQSTSLRRCGDVDIFVTTGSTQ